MRRRGLLKQMLLLPAAGLLASMERAEADTTIPIDDLSSKQKRWPVKSLTSYTTREANDLVELPEKPVLLDFLKHRFLLAQHLVRAAEWAMRLGLPEPIALACLLHDIGQSLARPDHGYWGAQLVAPYVSEEVSWAIRLHQVLRFYPDPANGYKGPPEFYKTYFGPDAKPDPYIEQAYKESRDHKWYLSARLITMADQETPEAKDLYVNSKQTEIEPDRFTDVIGRHFKQPKEGLGYDNTPVSHMWRTMINPDAPL